MQEGVFRLLTDAGTPVSASSRSYRPTVALDGFETKILKPQNILEMLAAGSRDVGFAGADWVQELDLDLVEVLDTGLDPVRIVAAAPTALLERGALPRRPIVVASEYENLTRRWIEREGLEATFVRSFGATEVFPPEDADCIVDNTATGSTLRANDLTIVATLATSSTRLYASPKAMERPEQRQRIEHLALLVRSVLDARTRVMLEANVPAAALDAVVDALPCMREPTVSPLHGVQDYAVKAAVPRRELPDLISRLKELGATDLVVASLSQIIP